MATPVQPSIKTPYIKTVVIKRPEKRNALSPELMVRLRNEILAAADDDELRVLILTGGGTVFCAGADVTALAAASTPEAARELITTLHRLCQAVRDCPVPVIAAIDGPCLGAGLELAVSCDIRIAGDGAVFGMPEVRLGLPSVIEAALLPRLMGAGPAAHLLYTGATITADDAYRWGLVTRIVTAGQAASAARGVAEDIAACGPAAVRTQKQLLRHWETATVDDAIEHSITVFAEAHEGSEPTDGTTAWLEKRSPAWKEPLN